VLPPLLLPELPPEPVLPPLLLPVLPPELVELPPLPVLPPEAEPVEPPLLDLPPEPGLFGVEVEEHAPETARAIARTVNRSFVE